MESAKHPTIDHHAAAERLLVALSFIGAKLPNRPVPAIQLCAHLFDRQVREHWNHESKRRRVRETVAVARELLTERRQGITIVADGRGYWLTGNAHTLTWYADQRRRHGLRDLAAGKHAAHVADSVGQKPLFPEPPPEVRH